MAAISDTFRARYQVGKYDFGPAVRLLRCRNCKYVLLKFTSEGRGDSKEDRPRKRSPRYVAIPSPVRRASSSPTKLSGERDAQGRRGEKEEAAPALITSTLKGSTGGSSRDVPVGEPVSKHKAPGRPKRQVQPLTVPNVSGRTAPWASILTQMDAIKAQAEPGIYVLAWIEPQPELAGMKAASMSLFYVMGVGKRLEEGLDLEVRLLAARAPSMAQAIEKGTNPDSKRSLLHSCSAESCVQQN